MGYIRLLPSQVQLAATVLLLPKELADASTVCI